MTFGTYPCVVSTTPLVIINISMPLVYANCSNHNLLCNALSSAYLPAITVCNQALYSVL